MLKLVNIKSEAISCTDGAMKFFKQADPSPNLSCLYLLGFKVPDLCYSLRYSRNCLKTINAIHLNVGKTR